MKRLKEEKEERVEKVEVPGVTYYNYLKGKEEFDKSKENLERQEEEARKNADKNETSFVALLNKAIKDSGLDLEMQLKESLGVYEYNIKDRKELSKVLESLDKANIKASIKRGVAEGYRYLLQVKAPLTEAKEENPANKKGLRSTRIKAEKGKGLKEGYIDYEDFSMERDGEQDDEYLVIPSSREGYGISQVEDSACTVGELIERLQDYDPNTKVIIGNDQRGYGWYTYGTIDHIYLVRMEDAEEEEEDIEESCKGKKCKEECEKQDETLKESNGYGKEYYEVEEKDYYEDMLKDFSWEDEVEYQFPPLTKEDLKKILNYDLEVLGKLKGDDQEEQDVLIAGKLKDIIDYADKELGYALHPDFLYHRGDFDTEDLLESVGRKGRLFEAHYNKETGKVEADWFYGVPEVEFIWHGEWADPEVEYKGNTYNYYDLEDSLWVDYKEEKGENANDDDFEKWVKDHQDLVYSTLEILEPLDESIEHVTKEEGIREDKEEKFVTVFGPNGEAKDFESSEEAEEWAKERWGEGNYTIESPFDESLKESKLNEILVTKLQKYVDKVKEELPDDVKETEEKLEASTSKAEDFAALSVFWNKVMDHAFDNWEDQDIHVLVDDSEAMMPMPESVHKQFVNVLFGDKIKNIDVLSDLDIFDDLLTTGDVGLDDGEYEKLYDELVNNVYFEETEEDKEYEPSADDDIEYVAYNGEFEREDTEEEPAEEKPAEEKPAVDAEKELEIKKVLEDMNTFEFESGDYCYVGYEDGKLFAGSAANAGIFKEVEIDYDFDESVDANLDRLYNAVIEKHPEYLDF